MAGCLQPDRLGLVRLEALERLGGLGGALEAEDAVLGRGARARLDRIDVDVVGPEHAHARAVDRQRLVLDDRVHPARRAVGVEAVGVLEELLERALIGVVGVVGAQAEAPRDAQHRLGVLGDQVNDERARRLGRAARAIIGDGVVLASLLPCC